MNTAAAHRHTRTADALINRLHAIMLAGAAIVATLDDAQIYATPPGRFFVLDAGGLRPITAEEAADLVARAPK